MRLLRFAPLLVLAACGDDNPAQIDAPVAVDAPIDTVDAPPDAMVPVVTRVWATGNFIDVNKRQAGAWMDGATLPFGNGTATPILVPSGTAVLGTGTGYSTLLFDVSRDGTKTVYVADATVAGRFDLYVANSVGGSPMMLVQGSPNIEIASVTISPNGAKVAYTMDSLLVDGGYDLYWTSTTPGGTPTKVSPARPLTATMPANLDVSAAQVFWSNDSKYLAFVGDLTEDAFNQAYNADTSTTSPAVEIVSRADIPGTSLIQGIVGQVAFDAANNLYYGARLLAATPQVQLYRSMPDGTMRTDITNLVPMRTDTTVPDVAAFGITPDGMKLVIAADTPTASRYDMYLHTIGGTTSTNISNHTLNWSPNTPQPFWFSPDGMKVAVIGRFPSPTGARPAYGPFVFKLDGSGFVRTIDVATVCTGCATPDAQQIQWTLDSQSLYVRGDITTNNLSKLYKVSASLPDQTPTIAADAPAASDVFSVIIRPQVP